MAQQPPMFSSQRNFKHGDTRQERRVNNKYNFNMMDTPPTYQNINQSEKKADVYVHRFNKVPSSSANNFEPTGSQLHQNTYKHELSDYYTTKARYIKKQFDSLNLNSNSKTLQMKSSPCKFTKSMNKYSNEKQQNSKISQSKSTSGPKIPKSLMINLENKAVVDKLEETYWSKWKPNKDLPSRPVCPKTKGLYTENEKITVSYPLVTEPKERGDSNEGIAVVPQNSQSEENCMPKVSESELRTTVEDDEKVEEEINTLNFNEKEPIEEEKETTEEVSVVDNNNAIILMPESPSSCDINELKHTDSYILTSKKKNLEKSHFQQPKCIKLFKNAGYTTKTSTNYIKGGSYPLKSCLKKEKNDSKISCLSGHSVTPVRSSMRRPGKANRFTT